ncbi:MAG: ABC transporter ATP-binding protein [Phycisphaeraceae bacterium]|nr:ABC transporter ATP-binding protein [Phycisphaeraceae bacterium]
MARPSLRASTVSNDAPVVVAQGVTKVFRDFWLRDRARAVDNLTFQVNPHEVFGLLGPNGSGKSTTIKMILGLLRPTRGRVAVFGAPPTDVATKNRVGYLPEESYLYGFLNARETLEYYAKLFGLASKVRQKRVEELIEMVGLSGAQFRPVREYSKGMQRRIGIAQALINDPDFLILDEPTTGLDPIGTRQVKDLILRLAERGKTILLSSHLLADVEDVVDRMIILYGGTKREEGTCDELLTARHRTTLETDALDDETIAEIDGVIRRRTRGDSAIHRVSSPRQTLEEKFLDIVARAREERAETSGALSGAGLAGFLSGPAEGQALIEQLVSGDDGSVPPPEVEAPTRDLAGAGQPNESVIEGLLQGAGPVREPDQSPAPHRPPRSAPASRPLAETEVDDDVIASLMDDRDQERAG